MFLNKMKKITRMITIMKTSRSCLSNRIVPCIYLWSHVRLPAASNLNRQLNTYIIRIHSSSSTTPIDTLDYWRHHKHYTANQLRLSKICCRQAMASQAYVEKIFAVCGLLTMHQGTAINHINKTLEMRMCHKLNRKML